MALKRNANASIWEIIPLYAFRKMFPQLRWSNEFLLKNIPANTTIDVSKRRYDMYSPVINAAIEISRIGAHNSRAQLDRDRKKQTFSNEAHVTLYHIRDVLCEQQGFTNVHTFTVGEDTKDINFPIRTLCSAIEATASDIERTFQIQRKTNINYGQSIGEIRTLYEKITGKVFDDDALNEISDKRLSKKLDLSLNEFRKFRDDRNITSAKAFQEIQNHKTKYVRNGNFLAKNICEAAIASYVLKEKDKEIERLQNQLNAFVIDAPKKQYKPGAKTMGEFELLKEASRITLAKKRKENLPKINIKRNKER